MNTKLDKEEITRLKHIISKINDNTFLSNHTDNGEGTGVVIYNEATFRKDLKEIDISKIETNINWDYKFHKIYFEKGEVISCYSIKDESALFIYISEFDAHIRQLFRNWEY